MFQFQLVTELVGRDVVFQHHKLVQAVTRFHTDCVTDFVAVHHADRTEIFVNVSQLAQIVAVKTADVEFPEPLRRDQQLFRQLLLDALSDAVNRRVDEVVPFFRVELTDAKQESRNADNA